MNTHNIALIVAALYLAGCGTGLSSGLKFHDAAFMPYVAEFSKQAAARGKWDGSPYVTIQFGTPGKGNAAFCQRGSDFAPVITVDRNEWEHFQEFEKTAVIAHELGHCTFGRVHDNTLEEHGCPITIMNYASITNEWCWNNIGYWDELFN